MPSKSTKEVILCNCTKEVHDQLKLHLKDLQKKKFNESLRISEIDLACIHGGRNCQGSYIKRQTSKSRVRANEIFPFFLFVK